MWIFDTVASCSSYSSRNYGECGSIEVNTRYVPQRHASVVAFKTLTSLAMMGGFAYWMFTWSFLPQHVLPRLAVIVGVEMIYVALSFFIVPRPNYDDMGYFGGLINNPWRYSDNYNRSLRDWNVLLGPGRFISSTMLDCAAMLGVMKPDPTEEMRYAEEMGLDPEELGLDPAAYGGSSLSSATCTDLDVMRQEEPPSAATPLRTNRGDFD